MENETTSASWNEVSDFRDYLKDSGYKDSTIASYSKHLLRFLSAEPHSLIVSGCLPQTVIDYMEKIPHCSSAAKEIRAALNAYCKMLTGDKPRKPAMISRFDQSIETAINGFEEFGLEVKRLTPEVVRTEALCARRFLAYVEKHKGSITFALIGAKEIRDYLVGELANLKPSSRGRFATALRNFFRYLQYVDTGIDESIFALPLSPRVYKFSSLPETLDDAQVDAVADSFNKTTATGARDYAIMLFLVLLGLRCKEVANLSLDDIHWEDGFVDIVNTKTRVDRRLPLPTKLGDAIVDYILNYRPTTCERLLFIRHAHTVGEPMGPEQIRGAMRRAYARSDTHIPTTGTHVFRKTFASRVVRSGQSLKCAADLLGHMSLDSTTQYVKLDTEALRFVEGVWPGGENDA